MGIQKTIEIEFSSIPPTDKSEDAIFRRNLLKLIIAEFQRRPNLKKELSDEETIKIIGKYIKNNDELAKYKENKENILRENKYLKSFLPHEVSSTEIHEILSGIELIPNIGRMTGIVMGKIKATGAIANGKLVKETIETYLKEKGVL